MARIVSGLVTAVAAVVAGGLFTACATVAQPGAQPGTPEDPVAPVPVEAAQPDTAPAGPPLFRDETPGALQRAIAALGGSGTLHLAPGRYILQPSSWTDPSCGNCEDASESVPATLGMRITGRDVHIRGVHRDSVAIETRAGYGLLFEDCANCTLSGMTITGGIRDDDGRATSAGIVARRTSLTIEDCRISDNVGDSATVARTVVGIAGIAGREGSNVTVRNCAITRNSWDGIALYRGARAHIHDNVVDGVDKASGAVMTGGRGVGIGLTWDARAVVERNLVTRYWKGIGAFVEADADIRDNIVEDILTWGITLWGPSGATPSARIEGNVVYRTGACGVSVDRPAGGPPAGTLRDNVVVRSGQAERYDSGEPYCWQRPIARHQVPESFVEGLNLLYDNRQPAEAGSAPPPLPELLHDRFVERARPLTVRLAGYPALREALLFREMPELGR
ncbi:MAG TPA: right-handed parallel beta-helix repeat-containing protein [Longimicrobiales bacterium]|nr:right-handed parallel beta-helix repeat-containing protein [Longimicrobiales bacterium]